MTPTSPQPSPSSQSSPAAPRWDAVVVGGGPAGASAAAWLARAGRAVLVVERAVFPRFHIGESLLPATTPYLDAIGARDLVAAAGFPAKRGAFIASPDGEHRGYADFRDAHGIDHPVTVQVPRDRFDQLLLDHAAACGATVLQGTRAREVEIGDDGVGVTLHGTGDGPSSSEPRVERARHLIDASGRDGFLSRRLGLRRTDDQLLHVGIHAWYEGVEPPPPGHEGDLRLISLDDKGWAWLIPVSDTVTSVGVVVPKDRLDRLGTTDPAERLEHLLATVPALPVLLRAARRIGPVRVDGDYSYSTSAYCGLERDEPWLLAGDAGSFLDPVFSTGVLLALRSGVESAQAVDSALATGSRRRPFAAYERRRQHDYDLLRELVLGFYRPEFRDFLVDGRDVMGMRTALITLLAGNLEPSLGVRLRLRLFRLFERIQKQRALVPRVHRQAPPQSQGPSSGEISDGGSYGTPGQHGTEGARA